MKKKDPELRSGEETRSDADEARKRILARRASFVAAALAGVSTACGKEPAQPPQPCLSPVLVVEDEPVVRGIIVEMLHDQGYRTREAPDGAAGLRILQLDKPVDLLLTDIGLPGMNGRQLADQARKLRPNLKILFMTGYAENAANAEGFLQPGMDMITKPFDLGHLSQRVRDIISS